MLNRSRLVLCAAVFSATAVAAAAEPISAVYNISVVQRFNYQTGLLEAFSNHFVLTLTFDGRSTLRPSSNALTRTYGPPSFSGVPGDLVVAAQPADTPVIERRSLTDAWIRSEEGYRRFSTATVTTTDAATFGDRYAFWTSLSRPSFGATPSPPELGTISMLQGLGAGDLHTAFLYTGYSTDGSGRYLPNSFQYQGFSVLVRYDMPGGEPKPDPMPPIPEPATVVLLGTGLVAAIRYRHGAGRNMWKQRTGAADNS